FSINSLTTEAGLSTTSPAAIWLAISSERTLIFGIAHSESQLAQLRLGHWRGGAAHHVHGARGFRKGDDIANRRLSGQDHHHSIQSKCDTAVRRSSVLQGFQKEAEFFACLFL